MKVGTHHCQLNLDIHSHCVSLLTIKMTLENLLSQIGTGTKQLSDRYSEYTAPVHEHDHHVYYSYDPSASAHGHVGPSKHNFGSGHKSSASMSALTLLAFLFFLHILQQCIKDHMVDMSSAQPVVVMTASREGEDIVQKSVASKIDKTGYTKIDYETHIETDDNKNNKITDMKHFYSHGDGVNKKQMQKGSMTAQTMKYNEWKSKYDKINANRSSAISGFVNAMSDD